MFPLLSHHTDQIGKKYYQIITVLTWHTIDMVYTVNIFYGWQSSLQRTSLQEDMPPGRQASRRTRLQADTPPGDTPPADGQVKLGPLPPEDTPPEDKPPGDIPPVDKPPEDEPPGGHPSRPPGGQASSLKNCYVQIKGAT